MSRQTLGGWIHLPARKTFVGYGDRLTERRASRTKPSLFVVVVTDGRRKGRSQVECDAEWKRLCFFGENIVNAADLQHYKRLLLAKLDELPATRGGAEALVPAAGGWQGDLVDQANSDAEAELQVRVHQSDAHLLRAIEEALARIRRGTFGVCEVCKLPISKARLEAVPWTRRCRECKERQSA